MTHELGLIRANYNDMSFGQKISCCVAHEDKMERISSFRLKEIKEPIITSQYEN